MKKNHTFLLSSFEGHLEQNVTSLKFFPFAEGEEHSDRRISMA